MLESVHIKAFRSCRNVSLEFTTPIVALVGRNGAGKTNILKAIEWLARTATSLESSLGENAFSFHSAETIEVGVGVALRGKTYQYKLAREVRVVDTTRVRKATLQASFRETLTCTGSVTNATTPIFNRSGESLKLQGRSEPYRIGPTSTSLPALAALLPPEDPLVPLVLELRDFLSSIRYYPLDEPMDPGTGPDDLPFVRISQYSKWRALHEVGEGAPVVMRLLQLHLESPDRFAELQSLLGPDGLSVLQSLGFRTLNLALGKNRPPADDSTLHMLELVPSGVDGPEFFSYGELSAGTRRIIRLLVSLLADKSSVMLLEQPEDSIHSGLTTKLLGLLKTYSKERAVVMTTHSAAMFNALEPASIRLVTMQSGTTHVRPLNLEELTAAQAFLEDEGSLSDFLETVQED